MRNITTEGQRFLNTNSSITIYHLVQLETAGSTTASPTYYYLTDAPMPITWNGNQYSPNKLTKVGALTMATGLQTHKVSVDIAGEYQEELDRGLIGPASNSSYLNKEVIINRVYLDSTGNLVNMSDDNNGAFYYFRGLITDINIKETVKSGASTVTWSCANHFEDFKTVNGRLTDDYVHRGLTTVGGVLQPSIGAKKVSHQSDKGFLHANKAIDVMAKYTTQETRYKTKSSWGGFKSKVTSYEVDVVNELDLRFDLSAKFLPVIYGVRKTSGIPVFIDVDKNNTDRVYVVYAVAEGPIDGFLDVIIDGVPAVCSDSTHSSSTICIGNKKSGHTLGVAANSGVGNTDPTLHGRTLNIKTDNTEANFTFYNGLADQTADPGLVALNNSRSFLLQESSDNEYWGTNHRLLDTAYVVMEYVINEDATSIPEIEFVVQGKRVDVYSTPDSSANKLSLNPVWHLLDYMRSAMYGGNLSAAQFNMQSFLEVANELNVLDSNYEFGWLKYSRYIGWENTSVERRQKVQCNTLLPGSTAVLDNIKSILEQFDGTLNLVDGLYHLTMKRVTNSVADISISDIKGAITTKSQNNKDTWNTIQASIEDPAIGWSTNKITFFNNEYKIEDRNNEKKGQVSFKHITNYYTARSRAEIALNQSRYSREFTFTVWHAFSHIVPNDIITLTYNRFRFNRKPLMVKKVIANYDGTFTITAMDYDPSIYNTTDQVDNGDNEGSETPGVPRVSDIHIDTYFGDELEVHGVLNWEPVLVGGLSHYEVRQGANRYTVLKDTTTNIQMTKDPDTFRGVRPYLLLKNLSPSADYTFEVRSVLLDGRASSWQSVMYTAQEIDSNLPLVTGFRVINLEPGYEDQFYGGTVRLEWDGLVDENVTGYIIEFISGAQDGAPDSGRSVYGGVNISRTITEPEKLTFNYTLSDNMSHYASKNGGAVGVYRDLGFRIKATNASGGRSREWTYIE